MKVTVLALSLLAAAAAGGTTLIDSTPSVAERSPARTQAAQAQSPICRWLGNSDANSQIRLWFACR